MEHEARTGVGKTRGFQTVLVTILRIAIGWHFLYEGLTKVLDPQWTSAGYLANSRWFLADFFDWIAQDATRLGIVDFLNEWGLVLIGLGLMLGLFTRLAAAAGVLLLALYYAANPPFLGNAVAEGHYLFIDKNLVELVALLLIAAVPAAGQLGLDRLRALRRGKKGEGAPAFEGSAPDAAAPALAGAVSARREVLKSLASLPFLGAFAYAFIRKNVLESHEEKNIVAAATDPVSAVTGATLKTYKFTGLEELKGKVPHSKIGKLELSRVILGGNLIGGWAHARDLIYVSKLVKAYHNERKIFETLYLAEQCGINTILTNPVLSETINKYWERDIGKIQFVSDCALKGDLFGGIKMSIDHGAHSCYVQGGIADRLVANGKLDDIARALDMIRDHGLPAGIGGHKLETIKACVDAGMKPDYWMKTLHTTNYWSAKPEEQHNNIWCTDPEETVAYMKDREEPWIAFKTLAAGALEPQKAFRYAFESGADFICVGMYDFQMVDDVNIALDVLRPGLQRKRPWRAV